MTELTLKLTPRRAALLDTADTEVDVLVSLRAPDAPPGAPARPPLTLAIVIDRSGSMSGRPLKEAKRCAAFIVESLGVDDRASVIAFDDEVEVVAPGGLVGDKAMLLRSIAGIDARGSTALHDGWLRGAEQAAHAVEKSGVSRVLLLTDGEANKGLTNPAEIAAHCGRLADAGVTTSTYGLGQRFNEVLLTEMARSGAGQSYYGETAEDLMDPFREEFDLMSALCARKVRLAIETPRGVTWAALNRNRTDAEGRLILSDLAFSGEAWAVLRLRVPKDIAAADGVGDVHVLTVRASFEGQDGVADVLPPAHLRLPRVPAVAFAAVAQDDVVAMRAKELRAADLQEVARVAARQRDWVAVDAALLQAREEAGDNEWVREGLFALEAIASLKDEERFSKAAHYKSMKMRSRLSDGDPAAAYSLEAEASKARYLRRKPQEGKGIGNNNDPNPPK